MVTNARHLPQHFFPELNPNAQFAIVACCRFRERHCHRRLCPGCRHIHNDGRRDGSKELCPLLLPPPLCRICCFGCCCDYYCHCLRSLYAYLQCGLKGYWAAGLVRSGAEDKQQQISVRFNSEPIWATKHTTADLSIHCLLSLSTSRHVSVNALSTKDRSVT